MKTKILAFATAVLIFGACTTKNKEDQGQADQNISALNLDASKFKSKIDGKTNALYLMKNANGMEVAVTNYGGRIVSVLVPDRDGKMQDVVLGFDNIADYTNNNNNFGAIIGRYGNRIAHAKFVLNTAAFTLRQNNGQNCLHGGPRGFDTQMFDISQADPQTLVCTYLSKHNEEGFPGNLNVTVTYTLSDDNALAIKYEATTDRPTVVNLTNHSYFNLSGDANNTILDHTLVVDADTYTPTNEQLIPTGKIEKLAGTPLNFKNPTVIGQRIDDSSFIAIKYGMGYDHNFVLNKAGDMNNAAAKLVCPSTGISMEVFTNEPAIQVYTGNFLDGTMKGKNGVTYQKRTAICLETQHFPDSPNQPQFPSTELRPEGKYLSLCTYKFGVE